MTERKLFPRNENEVDPDILQNARRLSEAAKADALARLPEYASNGSRERVINAIENRFLPHVTENLVIAEQIESAPYQEHVEAQQQFLGTKIGFVVCPDGRIIAAALIEPRVGSVHRRLQGMPEVRASTRADAPPVLDDPSLAASISTVIKQQKRNVSSPYLIEFLGPHIDSMHPDHGCGAGKIKTTSHGKATVNAMQFGAVPEYFKELGDDFFAFNNVAQRAGGNATTFDLTHDSYSQGLIFGLRDEYLYFDPSLSLRENLVKMNHERQILMTELLDDELREEIRRESGLTKPLNIYNPSHLANNMMIIGQTARNITERHAANGFPWIPRKIRDNPEIAVNTLAYVAVRNSVYRVLSDIKPGDHPLLHHPERLIRIGPIGADFNVHEIPFIQNTPRGTMRDHDLGGLEKLYGLAEGILSKLGVDLKHEGRIILVTGSHDKNAYASPYNADIEHEQVTSETRNNAAQIRDRFDEGVKSGDTIVIGALHKPGSRAMIEIV